jgi:hypothetical protein
MKVILVTESAAHLANVGLEDVLIQPCKFVAMEASAGSTALFLKPAASQTLWQCYKTFVVFH